MSKAFTRERDDDDDVEETPSGLQPGDKNYITPQGAKKLQDELRNLVTKERPAVTETVAWAAANGDRSENADYQYGKRKLREIDRRIRFLTKRIDSMVVVDPTAIKDSKVRFGATVGFRDEDDNLKTYSIVGVDEIDIPRGRISWRSPLGSALLTRSVGDIVSFRTPKGVQEIEITKIEYKELGA